MRKFLCITLLLVITGNVSSQAPSHIDSIQFFLDEQPFDVTLTTDVSKLLNEKMKNDYYQTALFSCKLPDSSVVSETITINVRGQFRRSYCYMPPLRLNFHNSTSPTLYTLNSLKLACPCRPSAEYEQYILKEFLVYKIYNLLTDKSFRVRLLRLTLDDSKEKKKPYTQYAFMIESVNAMAKRNDCKEWKGQNLTTETTDRQQMTLVAVFEYMIGNTDWAVPNNHNIRLIYSKKDSSTTRPYAVPYDFDYSGLVNTDYAIPTPELGIESVRDRLYRGFPRTMDELENVLRIFNEQKDNIYSLINNFQPLSAKNKEDMTSYLDDFYKMINNPKHVEVEFIQNARTQ
jgi:hypothetical protein